MGRIGILEYHPENLILLCEDCHRQGTHSTNADVQLIFQARIAEKRNIDELRRLKWQTQKPTIEDLEALEIEYKQILSNLEL